MVRPLKIGNLNIETPVLMAPLAGFTDRPFRRIIWESGWEIAFTEMVSAQAIVYGNTATMDMLRTCKERKILGVQIQGNDPEVMAKAAKRIESNFDLLDINMGCPVKKVTRKGGGSDLLGNPAMVEKIVKSVVNAVSIPVTVKIRTGLTTETKNAVQIAKIAEHCGAQMVTVHGRTKAQGYSGKVDLETIAQVKQTVSIPVIGNGNIFSGKDAAEMMQQTACDGVMVARGALGNPWLFANIKHYFATGVEQEFPPKEQIREMLLRFFGYLIEEYGQETACKHFRQIATSFFKGYPHIKDFRRSINTLSTKEEMESLVLGF